MRILLLTRHASRAASSRMRTLQYLPEFCRLGWQVDVAPFFDDRALEEKYRFGSYGVVSAVSAYARRIGQMRRRHAYDAVWIEKEALPWLPAVLEKRLLDGVRYVLDYDDAVFHNYDAHRWPVVRLALGHRLDELMAGSAAVVAGNRYLAERAIKAGASRVEVLPTVVDLARYSVNDGIRNATPTIVWIGSPSTSRYLSLLQEPLSELAERIKFKFRVVGGQPPSMPGVSVEVFSWSLETEVALVSSCDVGVMPLVDSHWERGKCAYKLIQYMACALPTVASPVGANRDVVVDGETGYLADSPQDWVNCLETLLRDRELCTRLGQGGRKRVETEYSLDIAAPRLIRILSEAAGQAA